MLTKKLGEDCILITADLHLTDRKADEYRWELFPWIVTQIKNRNIREVFILGDLTHQKDNHSADLVLRLVAGLESIAELVPVRILKGNHDYVDSSKPFFGFLDSLENITYYSKPRKTKVLGKPAYFCPHIAGVGTKTRVKFGAMRGKFEYVFLHQCFIGAVAANGHELKGMEFKIFRELGTQLIAGDIHKPQSIQNLTYAGSPYPVAFGDDFKPRVLLLSSKGLKSIPRTAPLKSSFEVSSIEELMALDLGKGDQIRIVYKAGRVDSEAWSDFKHAASEYCEEMKISLRGIQVVSEEVLAEDSFVSHVGDDPKEILDAYCKENKITDNEQSVGLELLEE